jgi:hypothetical protein
MVLDERVLVGVVELPGEAEVGLPGDLVVAGAGHHVVAKGVLVDDFAEGIVLFVPAEGEAGVAQVHRPADMVNRVVISRQRTVRRLRHRNLHKETIDDNGGKCKGETHDYRGRAFPAQFLSNHQDTKHTKEDKNQERPVAEQDHFEGHGDGGEGIIGCGLGEGPTGEPFGPGRALLVIPFDQTPDYLIFVF